MTFAVSVPTATSTTVLTAGPPVDPQAVASTVESIAAALTDSTAATPTVGPTLAPT
ncbi:hypothetical protein SK128_015660, partial [Halocaridina rubra]